jgi:cell filamentation protein, protein adenylyltransferase
VPDYTLADGRTLKNKLGASTPERLQQLEGRRTARRIFELERGAGPKGRFDAAHLKALHQYIFQDVFEWAGRTRDERVVLADGSTAFEMTLRKVGGKPFLPGQAIAGALDALAARVANANFLKELTRPEFADRAADIMLELNNIHPFREGNGRTQRAFMRALASAAGHNLAFSVVSAERMTRASIAGNEREDPGMMRRMFDEISDPARVENLRKGITALEKLGYPWNEQYVATTHPGHSVRVVLAGISGEQFMARTDSEILFGRTTELPQPWPKRGESFSLRAHAASHDHTAPTISASPHQLSDLRRAISEYAALPPALRRLRSEAQAKIGRAAAGLTSSDLAQLSPEERLIVGRAQEELRKRGPSGPGLER